jgi:hypothetical protein
MVAVGVFARSGGIFPGSLRKVRLLRSSVIIIYPIATSGDLYPMKRIQSIFSAATLSNQQMLSS